MLYDLKKKKKSLGHFVCCCFIPQNKHLYASTLCIYKAYADVTKCLP